MEVFAIITNGNELDQLCHSRAEANREVRDLKSMGIDDVKIRRFANETMAYAWEEAQRGY